ncbi:MAG: hypothetical protein WCO56_27870 [Verrucomicrobiota bacterium]
MKLQQSQIWKTQNDFIRIVRVERLVVEYKSARNLKFKGGTHHHTSKKQFCRLIKEAILISPISPISPIASTFVSVTPSTSGAEL